MKAMDSTGNEVRHEARDIDARLLVRFAAALIVVMVAVTLVLVALFRHFSVLAARSDPPAPPLPRYEAGLSAPEPRLQTRPAQDLARLRAEEGAALNGYGWVDEQAGILHIPIGRAMELTVERGLPARAERDPAELPR
jgi:hypothetical protein